MEEILLQGQTGFLVEPGNCTEAASCVPLLGSISRARCREHVEAMFSLEKMIGAYEQVYQASVASVAHHRAN
jgi:glycosyltransferase involved in cell wall biosynthesis